MYVISYVCAFARTPTPTNLQKMSLKLKKLKVKSYIPILYIVIVYRHTMYIDKDIMYAYVKSIYHALLYVSYVSQSQSQSHDHSQSAIGPYTTRYAMRYGAMPGASMTQRAMLEGEGYYLQSRLQMT